MGRLKLIIKQGSNFSIELYSDNQNNSLLNLQGEKKLSNDVRKLVGVPKSGGNSAGNAEAYECLLTIKHLSFEKKVYSPCRILAIVRFPQNVSHSEVKTLFKNAGVELYNDDFNIAKDYYVHAVSLKYLNNGTSMEIPEESCTTISWRRMTVWILLRKEQTLRPNWSRIICWPMQG